MLKKFKFQILLFILLITGGIVVNNILTSYIKSEQESYRLKLHENHHEAVLRIETGINVYSTIVSSLKAYLQNSTEFPTEQELQKFIHDLVENTDFKEEMIVSFVDTNQIFRYSVSATKIDPSHLDGLDVNKIRPKKEIEMLNDLMRKEGIFLFDPINLVEGWAAFPFNFSARTSDGKILGYIAPVLNVKYLLNYIYKSDASNKFKHSFQLENGVDFTREEVFDNTKIYNKNTDVEYYKKFENETEFIYSVVDFYGLKIKVGTAYKELPISNFIIRQVTYLWYFLLIIFSVITILQFIRYTKIQHKLKIAKLEIEEKNTKLELKVNQVETLIKEVHHRVKNNMQIVSGILTLQSMENPDEAVKSALKDGQSRLHTMSLIHQNLYNDNNLKNINIRTYIEQLMIQVNASMSKKALIVDYKINIPEDLFFDSDKTIPIGLILNELATNSFKYGFTGKTKGTINLSIVERDNHYILEYFDDGIGYPKNFDLENLTSLGMTLIKSLTEDLNGELLVDNLRKVILKFSIQ